jgi:transcriptional regulator with XRE-family HTH domain
MSRRRWPKGTWMRLNSPLMLAGLLEHHCISMSRLARYSGCSKSFISHLTSGRRTSCTPRLAERIAEALGVPLEVLFTPRESVTTQLSVKRPAA